MPLRRLLCIPLVLAMACLAIPAPVSALSTASEIAQAKETDKQVVASSTILKDPLLNEWVNEVTQNLWRQVERKDLPYNVKIIDDPSINAFTIGGGYLYVNTGTLDFVQSDDELAGVLGHETGHDERRHPVTLPAKVQAANIIFGVASLFSPFLYRFGQLIEAGAIAKMQREDELEADRYGLFLMTRAGYDPDAMLSFMRHLNALHDEHSDITDKYFADHPALPDRISHLLGYPQLDPTKRTQNQIVLEALHDEDTARYNIAALKFQHILKLDPNDQTAMLGAGQMEIALGETTKGEQTLATLAGATTGPAHTAALSDISHLRESTPQTPFLTPNLAPLRASLAAANDRQTQAVAEVATRAQAAHDQLTAVKDRIDQATYSMPNIGGIAPRRGSRLEAVLKNVAAIGKSIDIAFGKSDLVASGVGNAKKGKLTGLLKENADILHELGAPLALRPIPPQSLALFSSYPRMFDDLALSDSDMLRSVDSARSSLALLDVGSSDLETLVQQLDQTRIGFNDDISPMDYQALLPLLKRTADDMSKAAVTAAQGEQLYDMARARQLQTRITMLGVGYPQDRFATLTHALERRVKNAGVDFTTMVADDLTPGEVAAAAIVAADTNTTPQAIVEQAKVTHRSIVDVANARRMDALSLEIFLGLVYLDYTDDPQKEIAGTAS